jgi:hypothetical protein
MNYAESKHIFATSAMAVVSILGTFEFQVVLDVVFYGKCCKRVSPGFWCILRDERG